MAMSIGVVSPGDMGHSVGNRLREHGARVLTSLEGRSERSRGLAAEAGIEDAGTLSDLVREVDVLLSILVPAEATGLADRVARALRENGASLLYVDCNAIAPQTVRAIGETILVAGGRFADVGIVGPPPRKDGTTRFYVSGPGAAEFGGLAEYGLDVRPLGDEVGKASGFKMCYAALTKGFTALGTELLVAARLLGIEAELRQEQEGSVPDLLASLTRSAPTMPQGVPLGRGDGGDSKDLRHPGSDAEDPGGGGGALRLHRRDRYRAGVAGEPGPLAGSGRGRGGVGGGGEGAVGV